MDSIFTLQQIDEAARLFLQQTGGRKVFAFDAPMGAGKTTFITAICKRLGTTEVMSSPTFSIINQYRAAQVSLIYHIDLYRLKNEEEALQAGVEDCYYSGHYCFVEWAQNAPGLLPPDAVHCFLSVQNDNTRKLQIIL